MDDNILRYTLRVNRTLFQKFRYVADYEGRSANREIEQYIKQRVKSFEEEHGEIASNEESIPFPSLALSSFWNSFPPVLFIIQPK